MRKKTPVMKVKKRISNHFSNYLKKKIKLKITPSDVILEKQEIKEKTKESSPRTSRECITKNEYLILLQSVQKLTK